VSLLLALSSSGRASEPPVGRPSEVKPATNKILCQLGKEAMLVQKGIASTPCSVSITSGKLSLYHYQSPVRVGSGNKLCMLSG
jgi:hypothetical protein